MTDEKFPVTEEMLQNQRRETVRRQLELQEQRRQESLKDWAETLGKQWNREKAARGQVLDQVDVLLFLHPVLADQLPQGLCRAWLARQEDRRQARESLYQVRQIYGEDGKETVTHWGQAPERQRQATGGPILGRVG